MRTNTIAIAMAALTATGAQAQTDSATNSVTLYGLIDTGVEHVTDVGPSGRSLTRMPRVMGTLPSRWGLRGSESLAGDLRAVFTLESGFAADSGASGQGGRLFGRQAFVGLSNSWGTLALGRQYTMLFWSLRDSDQLGPNIYGTGSLDSYLLNARADNAITYRGTFSGLTVGVGFSFGRDTVNAGPSAPGTNCAGENGSDDKECREWSAMVKYDRGNWGVALAADSLRGGPEAFGGLTSSAKEDRRVTINGYVKFKAAKLSAGLIRRDNDGAAPLSATNGQSARSDLYWVGGAYTVTTAFDLDGQVHRMNFKDGGDQSTLIVLRGLYNLSKRTVAHAQVGHISNGTRLATSASAGQPGSNPAAGGSQTGVMVGVRHSF